MNLPAQLGPIKETEINLLNGTTLRLPTCHPVFKKYRGTSINFTYGNKPILDYKGKPCFAELLILNLLLEKDWTGVWVETYGGTHFLQSMPQRWDLKEKNVTIPKDKKA
ncbi:MAG: hypothetical protein SVO01_13475, partial [Thermotogota bacterium]|nr:hypothetical protein [Thermotogota bacterium]